MLISTDNLLLFVSPAFTCIVFSVVYDVLRVLVSFSATLVVVFSLMKENSLRRPVLFNGAAFSSTISRLFCC